MSELENMYGCLPCPVCGGGFRYTTEGGITHCDDCGYTELKAKDQRISELEGTIEEQNYAISIRDQRIIELEAEVDEWRHIGQYILDCIDYANDFVVVIAKSHQNKMRELLINPDEQEGDDGKQ